MKNKNVPNQPLRAKIEHSITKPTSGLLEHVDVLVQQFSTIPKLPHLSLLSPEHARQSALVLEQYATHLNSLLARSRTLSGALKSRPPEGVPESEIPEQ